MTAGKRALDLTASVLGLLVISPLLLIVATAVKRDGGPVFFRQERVGRRGRPFRMWKFRTMVPNADRLGPLVTVHGDPRITRVGARLRHWKLDELPQLLNVISGDMTLVGPRPEVARFVDQYTPEERAVLELTPGITDPASIAFRDEAERLADAGTDVDRVYVEEIMPIKIRLNLDYARDATVFSDVRVVLETFHVLGADAFGRRPRNRQERTAAHARRATR